MRAFTNKNSDLIKYYLSFKEANSRDELTNTIFVNETTGVLTLNQTKIESGSYRRRIEFYVDAVVQCSFGQKMLQNQTKVQLNIVDSRHNAPTLNITHLWEAKTLKLGPKCLKIDQSELRLESNASSSEIALAQIQIENLFDYDLEYSDLSFTIDSIEPNSGINLVLRYDIYYKLYSNLNSK